jgi:hypothetical protein
VIERICNLHIFVGKKRRRRRIGGRRRKTEEEKMSVQK